jgi:spermidine/putrescine transport system permease protein
MTAATALPAPREPINRWKIAGIVWLAIGYVFLFIPLVVLVLFSFQANKFPALPLQGFSLRWYEKLWRDGTLIDALGHSMIVSPAAATIATILGFLAAYATTRFEFKGKSLLAAFLALPILIPPLILGVAFLGLLARVHLSGTLFSVFLTHVVLITAPAMVVIQLRLAQMPRSLEEAAWDLGATEWQTLRKVVLPFALPGILGGWLLAFTFSFDEFMIAWFVSGFDPTLPVAIYSVLVAMIDPSLNAIGTIVFAISAVALIGIELLLLPYVTEKNVEEE